MLTAGLVVSVCVGGGWGQTGESAQVTHLGDSGRQLDPHAGRLIALTPESPQLRVPVLLPQTMLGPFVRASSCLIARSISEYHK